MPVLPDTGRPKDSVAYLEVAQNYFVESRTFKSEYLGKTNLESKKSMFFFLGRNSKWFHLKPIDTWASFFNF